MVKTVFDLSKYVLIAMSFFALSGVGQAVAGQHDIRLGDGSYSSLLIQVQGSEEAEAMDDAETGIGEQGSAADAGTRGPMPAPDLNVGLVPEMVSDIQSAAQESVSLTEEDEYDKIGMKPNLGVLSQGVSESDFPGFNSLLYTPAQLRLVEMFEQGILFPKPVEEEPLVEEEEEVEPPSPEVFVSEEEEEERYVPPTIPSPRELHLAGIAYKGPDQWTIWLNGQRLTPGNVPESIFKINVKEEHVDIVWHDKQTHQVYPVRLRPHQRFNLDAKLFVPGSNGRT